MIRKTPLRRGKPLVAKKAPKRGAAIQRRVRMKPGGPIRTKPETRDRTFALRFHSEEYVLFVHSLGCAVPGCTRTDIQCAHVVKRSQGGTWQDIAPLCGSDLNPGHHQEQEGRTEEFNAKYRLDLEGIAHATAQRGMAALGLAR